MEETVMARIQEILEAYSECKELNRYDLALEAINDQGDVKVLIKGKRDSFERVIKHDEPLDWVKDTFYTDNLLMARSYPFNVNSVKVAYINEFGKLCVEHNDGNIEEWRIRSDQHDTIVKKLKDNLGKKFKH